MESIEHMIPYGRQDITQSDIDEVISVLRSDFLTQGPMVPIFEQTVASYCSAEHAVAVNSATAALHIACMALDLGPGDTLWTSANTFVASANCAIYCGATVDFVDIDPRTYNMSIESLSVKLAAAEKIGNLPKILVPVHLCGQSCDMKSIYALSQKYGFKIIEDASHAIGAKYLNAAVGSCRYSDITVFSFHPVKIITTGEGGMALTNCPTLAKRMRRYRSHGITSEPSEMRQRQNNEIWNYQQNRIGYNYRMTDVQAALGVSQMSRLDEYVKKRHQIASKYDIAIAKLPLVTPWQSPDCYSSYHLYPVRIQLQKTNKTQRAIYDALHASGVLVNLHYIPVYRQPYYEDMGFNPGYCNEAERYFQEALSVPIYPTMTAQQQEEVIAALKNVLTI